VIGWEGAIVEGVRAGGDAGLILAAGAMGRIEGVPLGGIISALVYRARVDSRVFLQVITAVRDISETRATEITDGKFSELIDEIIEKGLSHSFPRVRAVTVEVLGMIYGKIKISDVMCVLYEFLTDSNSIVRRTVIETCLSLLPIQNPKASKPMESTQSSRIFVSLFNRLVPLLSEASEPDPRVRIQAVKLVFKIANLFPEHPIYDPSDTTGLKKMPKKGKGNNRFKNRNNGQGHAEGAADTLSNYAFSSLCRSAMDRDVNVRAKAAGILGRIHKVKPSRVRQSLTKKIVKTHKYNSKNQEECWPGLNISRQLWAGALRHAWEDEFVSVRLGAVSSIATLAYSAAHGGDCTSHCHNNSNYKLRRRITRGMVYREGKVYPLSTDHLYILNACGEVLFELALDPDKEVRRSALAGACRIAGRLQLGKDHLKSILLSTNDSEVSVRMQAYRVISKVQYSSPIHLASAVRTLARSLPLDASRLDSDESRGIIKALETIGKRHAGMFLAATKAESAPGVLSADDKEGLARELARDGSKTVTGRRIGIYCALVASGDLYLFPSRVQDAFVSTQSVWESLR